jgi:hypothetical protein
MQSGTKEATNSEMYTPDYTFEDIFGPHNPLMIGGWGGKRTQEEWFLKWVRQSARLDLLCMGLRNYYSGHFEFPVSWDELEVSGYFPVRALDPITNQPFNFNKEPVDNEDFINMVTEASKEQWLITGQAIDTNGLYFAHTWDYNNKDEWMVSSAGDDFVNYPTEYAIRGYNLAFSCYRILCDYEDRRAEMPETHDQLLDSLWYVANSWAENDPAVDFNLPGGFMFGIDKNAGISVAIWRDESGQLYYDTRRWDPWPDGWHELPVAGEKDGMHGVGWVQPEPGFVPETILWTCNLKID